MFESNAYLSHFNGHNVRLLFLIQQRTTSELDRTRTRSCTSESFLTGVSWKLSTLTRLSLVTTTAASGSAGRTDLTARKSCSARIRSVTRHAEIHHRHRTRTLPWHFGKTTCFNISRLGTKDKLPRGCLFLLFLSMTEGSVPRNGKINRVLCRN